jgi:NNP family nitrate/nitrite transporter-like MFS transporter
VASVDSEDTAVVSSSVDVAPSPERLCSKFFGQPVTWLPAMGYLTTLGIELVIESKIADVLFDIYHGKRPGFTQITAGYYTSILCVPGSYFCPAPCCSNSIFTSGFLNVVSCPLGGFIGDKLYNKFGTKSKKVRSNLCGFCVGATLLAGGLYLQKNMERDAQRKSRNI